MGSTEFTAASGSFSSGRDEGEAIIITGAAADNNSLTTTIKAVKTSNRVTLAAVESRGNSDSNGPYPDWTLRKPPDQ